MMKYTQILLTVNFVLLVAVAAYVFIKPAPQKQGYVLNQELFEGFQGKQYLETKLKALQTGHQTYLDSLSTLIQQQDSEALRAAYSQTQQQFALMEQELSDKYTADIWKEINKGLAVYGEAQGYDFILGASGDGSLMYASEAENITADVVAYLNTEYAAQ